MRRRIGILVCLLVFSLQLSAVSYQPCKPSSNFRSTSVYVTGRQQPTGGFQSSMSNVQSPMASRATGSFSAISASNFETLNSEGGACYNGPRRGRGREDDYGGSGAIGDVTNHSPIGEVPWLLMVLLVVPYLISLKFKVES
jgi:hypothetical protein